MGVKPVFNVAEVETKIPKKKSKWMIFCVLIVVIVSSSVFFLFPREFNYHDLLKNKEKEIVYSSNSLDVLATDKVPVINIDSSVIDDINSDIMDYYQDYLTKFTQGFLYEYSVSDHLLSILIISQQRYADADHSDIYYRSYNIDLKNMTLLSDKDIFDMYKIDEDTLRYFITYKFVEFYNDLIKQGYFTKEECDFSCFMESKNIVNVMNDNTYYIENGKLILYKPFNIYTTYGEEKYFSLDSFRFVVKD